MAIPGMLDLREFGIAQARQIDAGNLGAGRRYDRPGRHRHGMISSVWGGIFSKVCAVRCSSARAAPKKTTRHSRVIAMLHLNCPRAGARSTAMKTLVSRIFAAGLLVLALGGAAGAEANQVRFARQLGLGYLQFYVMQDKQMVERQAERAGLGKITTVHSGMGTPTAITDALLSGNVDIVGIGLPAFLTLWDKTRGNMDVRGMMAMNRQTAYLNTRNPNIKSIRDFTDNDRIALPAPKVSVQAIMLQMIAEKTLGKLDPLDRLTVGMTHPDGLPQHAQSQHQVDPRFHRQRPHRAAGAEGLGAGDHAADDRREDARQVRRARPAHRRDEPSGRHRRDAVGQAGDFLALHLSAVPVPAARGEPAEISS